MKYHNLSIAHYIAIWCYHQ